jgi:ElaB/YqjD/DUF883 family membrane-anchored ribosome-binding protein
MVETTAASSTGKSKKSATSSAPSVGAADGLSAEPLVTGTSTGSATGGAAKERFTKAIEEAKAGAQAIRDEAVGRAGEYRERLAGTSSDWVDEAKNVTGQAKERATELAQEGKVKTTEALKGLSKLVNENAPAIDEKLGLKYGDYARSAAQSIDGAAAKLEAKELAELGEDAKEFVRKSPGLAIGMAAVAGFMLARLFKGSDE